MITNFEHITEELNEQELALIPLLVQGFKTKTKDNPVKAPEIVTRLNDYLKKNNKEIRLTEPRLRKCCNYIRSKGIIPLVATSKGYYVSMERDEIANQIRSLRERAASINRCADGLMRFCHNYGPNLELFNDNQKEKHQYG